MTQQEIQFFIDNKPIFDKYLKERGGLQVGDWFIHASNKVFLIIDRRHSITTAVDDKGNTYHWSVEIEKQFVWLPSTDDLEKIIRDKMVEDKNKWDFETFVWALHHHGRSKGFNSLHEALTHWVVELSQ